ncbi:MAG TPA: macro domain-containing protein [Candidatus Latescibacteria bacterium]|nr:macro domain-containing protein [Candidatus Latescibacterota bacterium]
MADISVIDGNIFTSRAQTLVNTVNCVGVMGAGIALECRLRYPEMHDQYVSLCRRRMIEIGSLWIYKAPDRWILNFPTKRHWKEPSKEEYLHAGLRKFMQTYQEKQIESIAFPLLGAQHGGLRRDRSQELMESYLSECRIPIEIYRYDPMAPDDLYDRFCELLRDMTPEEIKVETGLRSDFVKRLLDAVHDPQVRQLNRLASLDGIGIGTLEKVFAFARGRILGRSQPVQQALEFGRVAEPTATFDHKNCSSYREGRKGKHIVG